MVGRRFASNATLVAALVALGVMSVVVVGRSQQSPGTQETEPDLQGLWSDDHQTPLQRPARFGDREFLTEEERADLDERRAAMMGRDLRGQANSERDVAGAYNALFESVKPTGTRTSLVVDPPNGQIPSLTQGAKQNAAVARSFQLALLRATVTCKNMDGACQGGEYGPPSPRRKETAPFYNTDRLNRTDGPEDRSLAERCMQSGLPDFTGFRRIVQSPGQIAITYDTGQGQSWQRVVPIGNTPHLPAHVRQRWGDSRGRWEGKTLVIDVTNFSPKVDFRGSREGLHLVERWTRTGPETIEYAVTIDDPSTWTQPWTVKQELRKQDEQSNRFYFEPRCHEGNYGLAGMFVNSRAEERSFAEGRGPDPATKDNATGGGSGDRPEADPFTVARPK